MECKECRGKGIVEVPDYCGKSASMCCGGCVKDEICFVCDGYGELKEMDFCEDLLRMKEVYYKLTIHPFKHERTLESIYDLINDIIINRKLL